ncbi:unnamed protein product [Microthlaspi erraticum]|uniref:BAH domain-containing protein n=1 Tax=Microthlaspi erraticum TaxID=1685480 RepID=A0A6D2L798_9BRAS|nr:unnamed protein product [Microthlaspi erraticum]
MEPQIQRRSKRRGRFRRATVNFEIQSRPWAHHYRKEKHSADKLDRTRVEERKTKDLLMEYYCKSLYSPERGWFFRIRENEEERSKVKLSSSKRNERELFMTNECMNVQLKDVKGTASLEIRSRPWGHQFRKENTATDKLHRARAEDRKAKGLPTEYYCKSLYSPERGGFFSLPRGDIGRGSGSCSSCKIREDEEEILKTKLNGAKTGFISSGVKYSVDDHVYVNPEYITSDGSKKGSEKFKSGRNIGLKAFVVCHFLEIIVLDESTKSSFEVRVRRFYRPEDISDEKAYASHIQELYYSEEIVVVPPQALEKRRNKIFSYTANIQY